MLQERGITANGKSIRHKKMQKTMEYLLKLKSRYEKRDGKAT
jgi:hypothetical protein